ncbi:hypothetical protein EVAR_23685_1 [Eumeta japonica]|uniref:Uncharacterized protein n=1 Tax=Eumeta variegata TaxID=151549 RepID=A0A4C1VH89_EUMVA|nr:hypothetical protein EVAR_23685_1 [Eumeta japonica]
MYARRRRCAVPERVRRHPRSIPTSLYINSAYPSGCDATQFIIDSVQPAAEASRHGAVSNDVKITLHTTSPVRDIHGLGIDVDLTSRPPPRMTRADGARGRAGVRESTSSSRRNLNAAA